MYSYFVCICLASINNVIRNTKINSEINFIHTDFLIELLKIMNCILFFIQIIINTHKTKYFFYN